MDVFRGFIRSFRASKTDADGELIDDDDASTVSIPYYLGSELLSTKYMIPIRCR